MHFNLINPDTGNRIRMITQDSETGAELARCDLVKGYEFKKDTSRIASDEDFDSAKVESSSTIKIDQFVEARATGSICFDATYDLGPDDGSGTDAFGVLRDDASLGRRGRVGPDFSSRPLSLSVVQQDNCDDHEAGRPYPSRNPAHPTVCPQF